MIRGGVGGGIWHWQGSAEVLEGGVVDGYGDIGFGAIVDGCGHVS